MCTAKFSQAASTYNTYNQVQVMIGNELIQMVSASGNQSCLDFGCGTGQLTQRLSAYYPRVVGHDPSVEMIQEASKSASSCQWITDLSCIDADEQFDVIISNATLQWISDIASFRSWAARHLQDRGRLVVSIFGPGTFCELGQVWPVPLAAATFKQLDTYCDIFSEQFQIKRLEVKYHVATYPNLMALLKTIKGTGAYSVTTTGLMTPRQLSEVEMAYIRNQGQITATYEYYMLEMTV